MQSLQDELLQVPWQNLQHAYGLAVDTPDNLLALLSTNEEEQNKALNELWASICHQGSIYEASCAAIPFIVQILDQVPLSQKPDLLYLLAGLADRDGYADRDQSYLRMNHSFKENGSRQQRFSMEKFLQEGNKYSESEWAIRAHKLVRDGIPTYLPLLQSGNERTIVATLHLLSGFREANKSILPAIDLFRASSSNQYSIQTESSILLSLSTLFDKQSSHWEQYYSLVNTHTTPPFIRFAAAYAIAKYQPSLLSQPVIDVLIETLFDPEPLTDIYRQIPWGGYDIYKETCKILGNVGEPFGLQAFLQVLERGTHQWHILDLFRIAEALLDTAFFGGWVKGRYWSYDGNHPLFKEDEDEIDEINDDNETDEIKHVPSPKDAHFYFNYGQFYYVNRNDLVINCRGYDKQIAEKLKQSYEHEGIAAFSSAQQQALRTVLRCEPLWQLKSNFLECYGLPTTRDQFPSI